MDLKRTLESLLKQAAMYRDQGLVNEARDAYTQARDLIQSNTHFKKRIKNRDALIRGLQKKIDALSTEIEHLDNAPQTQEVSAEIQNLIKDKFSFTADKDEGALEGAIALAKFGQFQRAIQEFEGLIPRPKVGVEAAKNILRSQMAYASADEAVQSYEGWLRAGTFTPEEMADIRSFVQSAFEREGINRQLAGTKAELEPSAETDSDVPEFVIIEDITPFIIEREELDAPKGGIKDFQDVNAITIVMTGKGHSPKEIELTVNFQSKSTLSLLISSHEKALLSGLEVGKLLGDVLYYSPYALLHGSGRVTALNRIRVGPRQGDYSVDIEMLA